METTNECLGFVGLGRVGQPMARNLLKAGYQLRVSNRDPRKAEALVADGAHQCMVLPPLVVDNSVSSVLRLTDAQAPL